MTQGDAEHLFSHRQVAEQFDRKGSADNARMANKTIRLPSTDLAQQRVSERAEIGSRRLQDRAQRHVSKALKTIAAALDDGKLGQPVDLFSVRTTDYRNRFRPLPGPLANAELRDTVKKVIAHRLGEDGYEVSFDSRTHQSGWERHWRTGCHHEVTTATVTVAPKPQSPLRPETSDEPTSGTDLVG
jgi:hypothetical protein